MSSSAYPIIWALKHAPVVDAIERAILIAIADHGDADGCDCYPSTATLAQAALVDERTVIRRRDGLAKRGLIRRQAGPPPARWLQIPKHKRPGVWEVMIPFSWWSDAQRTEIDRMRAEKGRPPLTRQMRPDLAPPPAKVARSDKGQPAPNRRRKDAPPVSQTGVETAPPPVSETPQPLSERHPTPCLSDTQPSCFNPPVEPSPPPPLHADGSALTRAGREEGGREAIQDEPQTEDGHRRAAQAIVEALPPVAGRRVSARQRATLAVGVARRLAEGWQPEDIAHELTTALDTARSTGVYEHRLAELPNTPPRRRTPARPAVAQSEWCGACHPQTRQRLDDEDRPYRCPQCHPLRVATPAQNAADGSTARAAIPRQDQRLSTLLSAIAGTPRV